MDNIRIDVYSDTRYCECLVYYDHNKHCFIIVPEIYKSYFLDEYNDELLSESIVLCDFCRSKR